MKITVLVRQHASYAMFLALAVGVMMSSANAQVQFPVDKPNPKVGDVWNYRTVDLWTNTEQSTNRIELVAVEVDRFTYRSKSSLNSNVRTGVENSELGPCRSMRNSDQTICTGAFKFPMQLGQKFEYERQPWNNGAGYDGAKCEVKAEEKIAVAAGSFDTVRLECAGFWNRVFDGTGSGRFTLTIWYSAKVNRAVKVNYANYNGSSVNDKNQTELVEFTPSKN